MNEQHIRDILLSIGCPSTLKGFTYIIECVMLIDTNNNWTEIYSIVAANHNSSTKAVEHCLKTAFDHIRNGCYSYSKIEKRIGWANESNSASLHMLYLSIRKDLTL